MTYPIKNLINSLFAEPYKTVAVKIKNGSDYVFPVPTRLKNTHSIFEYN